MTLERLNKLRMLPGNQEPTQQEGLFKMEEIFRQYRIVDIGSEDPREESRFISIGDLTFDTGTKEVKLGDGRAIRLTITESLLFEVLARRRDQVVNHKEIAQQVWGEENNRYYNDNIKKNVQKIRAKLPNKKLIQTCYGVGYKML